MGYIKKLARKEGPFPRQQDLPSGAAHIGMPPGKMYTLSHGWASEMHPSPSGAKLKRLAAQLKNLNAKDEEDGVFIE